MLAFSGLAPLARPSLSRGAFAAPARLSAPRRVAARAAPRMAVDPSALHHVTSHLFSSDSLHAVSLLLSDAAVATGDAAQAATAAAADAKKSGWWDSFVGVVEGLIVSLHGTLTKAGVPGAYGLSIIMFTVVIKALTFPLSYKQMESTMKMQALAPRLRKIQSDYKDNPAVLNQMTAQLYKDEQINPLAGCLPVFAQIPVWIALYRSVLNLASDDLLNESFLWLPSLQGPVAKTGQGLNTWLFPLVNGAPPIGWHDALCYLVLPVVLVITQFYSQKLLTPPSDDPQQQQTAKFLKFMPLLIGWFSLNVPSGLGVYWVTNNLLSTAQTVYIRSQFPDLAQAAATSAPSEDSVKNDVLPGSSSLDIADGFRSNGASAKTTKAAKSKKRRKRR